MSDKTFVGLDITGFENTGKYRPVSRVTLMVDDENVYTAGDDTGLELTASCPHATQEMVNALLAQLQGYQYQSFTADAANLDPAAELGDGVTVNGVYSIISQLDDDGRGFPDISSPGEVALEEEYPTAGPMTQEFNRQIAETRSTITKTAEEIRLEVSNEIQGLSSSFTVQLDAITSRVDGLDGQYIELKVTLDGVTVTDASGTTLIKGSSIQTSTLYVDAAHITGTLTADQVNLSGSITFGDLSSSVRNDINDAYSMAEDAQTTANDTADTVGGWTYRGTTYIDGTKLMTGTVTASTLEGGELYLLDGAGNRAGSFTLEGASSYSGQAVSIDSGAIALEAQYGAVYLSGGGGAFIDINTRISCGDDITPSRAGSASCGTAAYPWSDVYAETGEVSTSDETLKNSIEPLPDKYVTMLDQIMPKRYKINNGTSGRYHVGFIAQDVEQAMALAGVDPLEFGGWIKDTDQDGNPIYMLRYTEFIAILWAKIRDLEGKINA